MKKIILALLCALSSLALPSCEVESMWEADDLVLTDVWTMTYSSTGEVWYFYPEQSFYISENGTTLDIVEMSDWCLTQISDDKIVLTLSSSVVTEGEDEDDSVSYDVRYNISFDSSSSEGTCSIQYFIDGVEDTSLYESTYIVGLSLSSKAIESR